jgi:histidine kinase
MKKNLLHQPIFRITVPPVYGLMMYLLILSVTNSLIAISDTMLTEELLLCVLLAYLVSESIRFTTYLIENKFDQDLKKVFNIVTVFVINAIVGTGLVFIAVYLYFTEYINLSSISSFRMELTSLVITFGISGLLYTLFYLSIYFLTSKNETEIKQEDLKRQNLEHQLEIFNNEINPDLLFQSLETLISLVHDNLDAAEDFVDRLSLTYRYILENRKRELVNLEEELKAASNLFHLFNEKYPGQLSFKIKDIKTSYRKLMVPNSIPILLDCIINGSIISSRQPVKIIVEYEAEEDYLVVQYSQNDKLSVQQSILKRKERLHEAYAYFSDRPVIEIKAYGDVFIKLPLLNINAS